MDGWTFAVAVLDKAMWPLVVAVVCWPFRPQLRSLLGNVGNLFKGARVEKISGPGGIGATLAYANQVVTVKEAEEAAVVAQIQTAEVAQLPAATDVPKTIEGTTRAPSASPNNGGHYETDLPTAPEAGFPRTVGDLHRLIKRMSSSNTDNRIKQFVASTLIFPPQKVERDLVQFAPTGAIIAGWTKLEQFLINAAQRWDPHPTRSRKRRLTYHLHKLLTHEVLDQPMLESIERFQLLRNEITHSGKVSITIDEAESYLEIRDRLIDVIKERVERKRLETLLAELGVDETGAVTVRLRLSMEDEVDPQDPRYTKTLKAEWTARTEAVKMAIEAADGQTLIAAGAKYEEYAPWEASPDDELLDPPEVSS